MVEVASCSKCGKSFDDTYDYEWCSKCGEYFSEDIKRRFPKLAKHGQNLSAPATSDADHLDFPVLRRYQDAYRVATVLVGFGGIIKVIGGVIAIAVALLSLGSAHETVNVAVVGGVFLGLMAGFLCWVVGILVSAQGQILQATLDTAVASSPFLSDVERADAMRLPSTVVRVSTT